MSCAGLERVSGSSPALVDDGNAGCITASVATAVEPEQTGPFIHGAGCYMFCASVLRVPCLVLYAQLQ